MISNGYVISYIAYYRWTVIHASEERLL